MCDSSSAKHIITAFVATVAVRMPQKTYKYCVLFAIDGIPCFLQLLLYGCFKKLFPVLVAILSRRIAQQQKQMLCVSTPTFYARVAQKGGGTEAA